jgi:diaminopimelate epimerase
VSRGVNFEKWQALGNDYVILDERALTFDLTPARIRRLCDPHVGIGGDGIVLVSEPSGPGFVARLRIFNPDGSESRLSGNGTREALLYLRRHRWTGEDRFTVQTGAGDMHATITSATTCTVDMGRPRLQSQDYPSGAERGIGELTADGRTWRFQHVQVGNPQCSIALASENELDALDLPAIGPAIEQHELFPNRTNVSWYTVLAADVIRARIFERGVGETSSSGTGAIGAAVAHVLRGGDSPVTVRLDGGELEVEVGEDLRINLTGWAMPVIRGTLAAELIEELDATE